MHSRSLATREKRVLRLKLELVNPRFGVLELDTSAGMYIKECGYPCAPPHRRASSLCPRRFVHGDLGRTEPSLASLAGCDADILQLDVLNVHDDVQVAAASSSS
jgi:tRNA pseudouridine synthase 10